METVYQIDLADFMDWFIHSSSSVPGDFQHFNIIRVPRTDCETTKLSVFIFRAVRREIKRARERAGAHHFPPMLKCPCIGCIVAGTDYPPLNWWQYKFQSIRLFYLYHVYLVASCYLYCISNSIQITEVHFNCIAFVSCCGYYWIGCLCILATRISSTIIRRMPIACRSQWN